MISEDFTNIFPGAIQSLSVKSERVSGSVWDTNLPKLIGATFFDSARWQDTFKSKVGEIHYIHFKHKGKIISGCSFGVVSSPQQIIFKTPFTSAYGGILAKQDLSFSLWHESIGALIAYCQSHAGNKDYRIDYGRRSRCCLGGEIHEVEDFSLLHWGYKLDNMQCEFYINLAKEIQLKKNNQTMIRKIERDKTFSFLSADVDDFIRIRKQLVTQQSKSITVPDPEIILGSDLFSDNIFFHKVIHENKIVAVMISDRINQHCCIARNWFVDRNSPEPNANLFLVWQWLVLQKERSVRFAGFGSSANTKKALNKGTIFFKERFFQIIHDSRKLYTFYKKQGD
ncbi:hypothetical protein [Maridesulfovibrio sp.]|uniref:hypothetical protein n=1 Tax=Maridesulfovibrio sp. TaxID=2795000 RepID=UPI0029CA8B82|nr:hypothetical protein [Maridesulfovibrio sp.]